MSLQVKIATEPEELAQIFRLNYKTFVEEIPQHSPNAEKSLVDKFHAENLYFLCLDGKEVVGMVAVRDRRPFSLDAKLPDLDRYLPPLARPVEIRLLTIPSERRHGRIFGLLMTALVLHCRKRNYSLGLISGRLENVPLYLKLGFTAFGPEVGTPGAYYQPMWIDWKTLNKSLSIFPADVSTVIKTPKELNFLPGPVAILPIVRDGLHLPAVSHRSDGYREMLDRVKDLLIGLTGAAKMEILLGSGSLANDVIAGQLRLLREPGLIMTNGAFGERLVSHAQGFQVKHQVHRLDWGMRFNTVEIEKHLDQSPELKWIWVVHCETSTGMLNPIQGLEGICKRRGMILALDCISSLGTVPVDLSGVHFASGVSGKGLGAFTGLSMVFYHHAAVAGSEVIPRYMDLEYYARMGGIPFSGSSNLLQALLTSLEGRDSLAMQKKLASDAAWLSGRLSEQGIPMLLKADDRSPAIFTIPTASGLSSQQVGKALESRGFLISYNSEYLLARNWIQICLMAEQSRTDFELLLAALIDVMVPEGIEI